MTKLSEKKCIPCEGGILPFDISEIHKYQKKVDGWDIFKNEKNIYLLEKKFKFKNFLESQNFVNEVGKYLRKKVIIQIFYLAGVMQK